LPLLFVVVFAAAASRLARDAAFERHELRRAESLAAANAMTELHVDVAKRSATLVRALDALFAVDAS